MGYEIIYDRRFIRAGDRYIPFALFGSNNVTEVSPKTGKIISSRNWSEFLYMDKADEMLLASAEELMAIVRQYHKGDHTELLKYRGKWIGDADMIRFFENGIKGAVTLEELRRQTFETPRCYIEASVYNDDACSYPKQDRWLHTHHEYKLDAYPKTSEELVEWVERAKAEKAALLQSGKVCHVYICIRLSTIEPLSVKPEKKIDGPCYAKCKYGFVREVADRSVSFDTRPQNAKIFENSDAAYACIYQQRDLGAITLYPAEALEKSHAPKRFILAADHCGSRVFILKKTRRYIYHSRFSTGAKRFLTEKEALCWFTDKVAPCGKFSHPSVQEVTDNA